MSSNNRVCGPHQQKTRITVWVWDSGKFFIICMWYAKFTTIFSPPRGSAPLPFPNENESFVFAFWMMLWKHGARQKSFRNNLPKLKYCLISFKPVTLGSRRLPPHSKPFLRMKMVWVKNYPQFILNFFISAVNENTSFVFETRMLEVNFIFLLLVCGWTDNQMHI